MIDQRISRRQAMTSFMAAGLAGATPPSIAGARDAAPVIDGLSFLPDDLADIPRSGIGAMICDISEVEEVKDAQGLPRYLRTFDASKSAMTRALARIRGDARLSLGLKGSDIGKNRGCVSFLQFQSTEMIESDLSRIAWFHRRGLRVWQLTHHNNTPFAGGAIEPVQSGLSPLGRDGLAEFNRLRILTDVSHGSRATITEAAAASKAPIIYSHGACRALLDHPRCIDDDGIRAIASRGGVIGMFMMSFWLTRDAAPRPHHFVQHIRHVIDKGGEDSVAVSNDFPFRGQLNLLKLGNDNGAGVGEYHGWWKAMHQRGVEGFETLPSHVVIPEFNHIRRMERIRQALEQSGMKPRLIDKVMGANLHRLLRDVLG